MQDTTIDLVTIKEAALRLRQPESTLRYWRAQGKGPAFIKLGRRLVCHRADLERFVAEQATEQGVQTVSNA